MFQLKVTQNKLDISAQMYSKLINKPLSIKEPIVNSSKDFEKTFLIAKIILNSLHKQYQLQLTKSALDTSATCKPESFHSFEAMNKELRRVRKYQQR